MHRLTVPSVRAFTSTALALSRCLISRVCVDVHKQLVMSREYWSWKFWSAGPIFSLENMVRLCKNWSGLKDARFTSSFLNRTQHDSSSTKGSLGNSVVYRRTSSPVIASESIPTDHSLDLRCCRQLDLQWPLPSLSISFQLFNSLQQFAQIVDLCLFARLGLRRNHCTGYS